MIRNFIKQMMKYIHQPACFFTRPWLIISMNTIIPALILSIYQPFEYRLNSISQLHVLIGFTSIVLFSSIIFFKCIPLVCKFLYQEDKWTTGKNLLHCLIFLSVTAVGIFLYDYHCLSGYAWGDYSNARFPKFCFMDVLAVFSIGIVPLTISYLLEKSHQLKQNLQEIKQMNQKLRSVIKKQGQPAAANRIQLSGETKDSLTVDPEQILYMESSGNYVDIHYMEEKRKHKMIRSTIKQMEEQLSSYPFIIRCHRAFIVNTLSIVHIGGNAQGYRLQLENCTEEIPVSRTYMKSLKACIN